MQNLNILKQNKGKFNPQHIIPLIMTKTEKVKSMLIHFKYFNNR